MPDEGLRTVLDVCSRMDWTGYEDSESKEVVSMMMMISGDKYFSFVRYGQKCRKCKQFYSRPLPFYFSESHIKWDGSHPWRSCNPIIRNVLRIQQLMMEPSQTDFSLVEPIYIFMFVTLNLNLGSRAGLDSSLNSRVPLYIGSFLLPPNKVVLSRSRRRLLHSQRLLTY